MITPIVKVTKRKKVLSFYTLTDYETWISKTGDSHTWKVKYYKGLGTSSAEEAREYFGDIKMNNYIFTDDTDQSMLLAFSKSDSNKRKDWLYQYDMNVILDHMETEVPIQDFIHKELIHFSNSDTVRSIGSVYDGLKPSQRKIIYACLKRKLYQEIKVAQLSGYVSEVSAYHHGEASLQSTIIGLAQDFVGSNNINLLMPNGQFGTRIMGGHDSASARYIHTELNPLIPYIFPKDDLPLLDYKEDDGVTVEPMYYLPIIPMVLVNGMTGIGTGFSTNIPKYSVKDIISNIKRRLKGQEYQAIHPSYRGFKGQIIKVNETSYLSKGVYHIQDKNTIIITELPIGKWLDDYKKFLETLLPEDPKAKKDVKKTPTKTKKSKPTIVDYVNNSTDRDVHFTITVPNGVIDSLQWSEDPHLDGIEVYFKLSTSKGLSVTNMHLYNEKEQITKYDNLHEIFDSFYNKRYNLYEKRKSHLLSSYEKSLEIISSKIKFIKEVIDSTIIIYRQKKDVIIQSLVDKGYPTHNDSYDYLVKLSLYSFTEEEMDKLMKEHDDVKLSYDILSKKTIEEIWSSECDELVVQMKKMKMIK